jgi:precorrin-6Y C5,15-methyltransferase (decarboxylating)
MSEGNRSAWLSVVGLHEDGLSGLGAVARALVEGAGTVIGDERMLSHLPEDGRERLSWPKPLSAALSWHRCVDRGAFCSGRVGDCPSPFGL